MSEASKTFEQSILDAEHLLKHFNSLNTKPPPADIEVLKRAGLIMALTAWETYVEDRLQEACAQRLMKVRDEKIAAFMQSSLEEQIRRLHNPTSAKTLELFRDYAGVQLLGKWTWNGCDDKSARQRLDDYIRIRGDVVHRSRRIAAGPSPAHPVTKEDLEKLIRFLRNLIQATEAAFSKE